MANVVTKLVTDSRLFYIVRNGEFYCAIEDKELDEHGRLKRSLNGLQMYADRELAKCLQRVTDAVQIEKLMTESGCTIEDAIQQVILGCKA